MAKTRSTKLINDTIASLKKTSDYYTHDIQEIHHEIH